MSGERVIFDRGARLYLGNLAMPVHASRDHRFLGFDGIEWLLIFGTTLLLGAIVTAKPSIRPLCRRHQLAKCEIGRIYLNSSGELFEKLNV
jgi:hypothetical protein